MTQSPTTRRVYLDHAASAPMFPEAVEAMADQLGRPGNPSALHAAGRAARRVVEESREAVAEALGARPGEVVFTSGGTESDNLAVKGLYWARRRADARRTRLLVSAVEHHAVLDCAHWLAEQGADVELLPVDREGRLDLDALRTSIDRDPGSVALVSVMWANNEVGTVQPVADVVALAHEHDIWVHTDAVQALGQVEVDFAASGVDAMTVTAHKIGGPVGVGALVVRRELAPVPLLHGGGQERDVRSGTLDAPAIRGFAVAARLAVERREAHAARLARLRDDLVRRVAEQVPDVVLNGAPIGDANRGGADRAEGHLPGRLPGRLPGNAHLAFPGCEGDSLLMLLDARGIECSTGSACSAGVPQPSHVLLAMGAEERQARSALRFTLGHTSTESDVDALVEAIAPVAERARAAGMVSGLAATAGAPEGGR